MIHPARAMPFEQLCEGLTKAEVAGFVRRTTDDDGLSLFCYAESCTYEKAWDEYTLLARGLILDEKERKVVATPFPKFFNVYEREDSIPDLPFETFEKLDGSLIIVFYHNGRWKTSTKGSFRSDQAKWALEKIKNISHGLREGCTYLFEAIYPQNRIVVHYPYEGIVLLSVFRENGTEKSYVDMELTARTLGVRLAKRHLYKSVSDLLATAKSLPATEEGFVLRFENGYRLKVKGDEYCRIHRIISRVTPLAMWEAMLAKDDLTDIRKQLPEEFWFDFDAIISTLDLKINETIESVRVEAEKVAGLSDKEVGLQLDSFPASVRRFIFPYRRSKGDLLNGKSRDSLFKTIRPTANVLDGYQPSYAINRVMQESA